MSLLVNAIGLPTNHFVNHQDGHDQSGEIKFCLIFITGTVVASYLLTNLLSKLTLEPCRNTLFSLTRKPPTYNELEVYSITSPEEARDLLTQRSSVTLETICSKNEEYMLVDPVVVQKKLYSYESIMYLYTHNRLLPHNQQSFNINEVKRIDLESTLIKEQLDTLSIDSTLSTDSTEFQDMA